MNVPHEDVSVEDDALLMLVLEASVTEYDVVAVTIVDGAVENAAAAMVASKWPPTPPPPSGELEVGNING